MSLAMSDQEFDGALRPIIERFEKFYLGRSSHEIEIARCSDLIVIRCKGVLTDAESRLLHADPTTEGREMIVQMYRKMVRQAQESLTGAVESTLKVSVRSLFCDLDPTNGDSLLAMAYDA